MQRHSHILNIYKNECQYTLNTSSNTHQVPFQLKHTKNICIWDYHQWMLVKPSFYFSSKLLFHIFKVKSICSMLIAFWIFSGYFFVLLILKCGVLVIKSLHSCPSVCSCMGFVILFLIHWGYKQTYLLAESPFICPIIYEEHGLLW